MTRPELGGLYAITPEMTDTSGLVTMTQQALTGGARLVQYRNKTAGTALRLEQAYSLAHLCRKFGVPFIVNDYLDLAVEVGADGVHVGRDDASVAEARRRLGKGKIIGVS
jgi:thiamine-phosphate pyrophosphorylase